MLRDESEQKEHVLKESECKIFFKYVTNCDTTNYRNEKKKLWAKLRKKESKMCSNIKEIKKIAANTISDQKWNKRKKKKKFLWFFSLKLCIFFVFCVSESYEYLSLIVIARTITWSV